MDDCGYSAHSVAAGNSQQLHDGWVRAHPGGGCDCICSGSRDSGSKIVTLPASFTVMKGDKKNEY
jgi:hypothetical protein